MKYSFPPAMACLDEIRIISADGGVYFNQMIVQNEYPGPAGDGREIYLKRNGWSYSPTYYFPISARELFVREGGSPYFGFGHKSAASIERYVTSGTPTDSKIIRRQWLFPWAFPVLALFILPSLFVRSWVQARLKRLRLSKNLCPTCGYDLRGSPEECPECGTPRISPVP